MMRSKPSLRYIKYTNEIHVWIAVNYSAQYSGNFDEKSSNSSLASEVLYHLVSERFQVFGLITYLPVWGVHMYLVAIFFLGSVAI